MHFLSPPRFLSRHVVRCNSDRGSAHPTKNLLIGLGYKKIWCTVSVFMLVGLTGWAPRTSFKEIENALRIIMFEFGLPRVPSSRGFRSIELSV